MVITLSTVDGSTTARVISSQYHTEYPYCLIVKKTLKERDRNIFLYIPLSTLMLLKIKNFWNYFNIFHTKSCFFNCHKFKKFSIKSFNNNLTKPFFYN